jgi:uncharacterized protein
MSNKTDWSFKSVSEIRYEVNDISCLSCKCGQSYGRKAIKKVHSKTVENRLLLCGMSSDLLKNWEKKSAERQKLYKQFLHRADKNRVLSQLPDFHEEAFSKIDCLQCANCCKNYSPRFKTTDVKRISKHLRMKESVFIETYLKVDEDGDFVAKTKPCPFLGADNYCSIYDERPSDCRRFPYTDEDVIIKRQALTLKNSTFCPITYYVLEKLMQSGK